jgi:hypothetical protein
MKKVFSILTATLVLLFCNCKSKNAKPAVVFDEHSVSTTYQWNGSLVTGTVTNLTDNRISYLELQMRMVDERLMPKFSFEVINREGIEPKGSWDFFYGASVVGARSVQIVRTIIK